MRKFLAAVLCIIICLSLCACNGVESELQKGIWCREYSAMGMDVLEEYEFEEDGTFVCTLHINGFFNSLDNGIYSVGEEEITLLYQSGEHISIDYTYESGTLNLRIGDDKMYNRTSKE